ARWADRRSDRGRPPGCATPEAFERLHQGGRAGPPCRAVADRPGLSEAGVAAENAAAVEASVDRLTYFPRAGSREESRCRGREDSRVVCRARLFDLPLGHRATGIRASVDNRSSA